MTAPDFYTRYEDTAALFGEAEAERRWFPHEATAPSHFSWAAHKAKCAGREAYDVGAVIDDILAGTYEGKPIPVPQSLNAAFDHAVRMVRET